MNEQTWIDPRIDRSEWTHGEWDNEPDKLQWTDAATGLVCLAKRQPHMGHWCGYVGVDTSHPWHGKSYDELPEDGPKVHGGLTFSRACQDGPPETTVCHIPEVGEPAHLWWFGFDCAHCDDASPQQYVWQRDRGYPFTLMGETYRSLRYVRRQCSYLARQIKEAA